MRLAQTVDWLAVAPALVVAVTALVVLLADLWLPPQRAPAVLTGAGVVGVLVALAFVGLLWGDPRATFCVGSGDAGFASCSYVVNQFTLAFQGIVLIGTLVVLLLAQADMRAVEARLPSGETGFLVLASATGGLVLSAARDLATVIVALEVVSLPAFALVGLRRRDRRDAEAALTFFIVSVVCVAVMIYGVSLVYGATGALHLDRIAVALSDPAARTSMAGAGVLLTLVGLTFKIGAVPFHFWVPDTYSGAPPVVAAYLAVVSKAAGLAGLVIVVSHGFPSFAGVWGPALGVLAVVTMTVGNVAALRQRTAIRLLAWSSVAHAGYLLVPLGVASAGTTGGQLGEAMSATVAYMAIYAALNLAAFGVVAIVARHRPDATLDEYRGLVHTEPVSAVVLAFALIALAGLPPGVAGLWAKVIIIDAAVSGGAGWLALAVAINTVIGLVYYLRWTVMLFSAAPDRRAALSYDIPIASGMAVGLAMAAGVVLSVLPQLVLGLAEASSLLLAP